LRPGPGTAEVVDLAEVDLPFLDERRQPRFRDYQHEHTKQWSARIDRADAYVFVIPEYNYGYNAVLKNAIDFLHQEWLDKPDGVVSYGGAAAGPGDCRPRSATAPVADRGRAGGLP